MKKTALTLALALSASSAFAQDCGKSKVAADVAGNNQVVASTGSSLCVDSEKLVGLGLAVGAAALIIDLLDSDSSEASVADQVDGIDGSNPSTSTSTTTATS